MTTQSQKTIFITGSSSGLGRATAKLFASKGWKVIATMRNPDKEAELNQLANVALLALDVTDSDQIKRAVDEAPGLGGESMWFSIMRVMEWRDRWKGLRMSKSFAWSTPT